MSFRIASSLYCGAIASPGVEKGSASSPGSRDVIPRVVPTSNAEIRTRAPLGTQTLTV